MRNEELRKLIEEFKNVARYKGILSPTTYQVVVIVLDTFYAWYCERRN